MDTPMNIFIDIYPAYNDHPLGYDLLRICFSYLTETEYQLGAFGHQHFCCEMFNGVKHGKCIAYSNDFKSIVAITQYTHGKLHGVAKRWHRNGKIKDEIIYEDDYVRKHRSFSYLGRPTIIGDVIGNNIYYTEYHDNGSPYVVYQLIDGCGLYREYDDEGRLITSYNFTVSDKPLICDSFPYSINPINNIKIHEKREGVYLDCTPHRQINVTYSNGLLEGKASWIHDGNSVSCSFIAGKLHGLYTMTNNGYYTTVNYVNGEKHGDEIVRHTSLIRNIHIIPYKYGKLHGTETEYYIMNGRTFTRVWRDNKREGPELECNYDGNIISRVEYVNNKKHGPYVKLVGTTLIIYQFYRGEKICGPTYVNITTGTESKSAAISRPRNGIINTTGVRCHISATYVNGLRHGIYQRWDTKLNKLVERKHFVRGRLHGRCIVFKHFSTTDSSMSDCYVYEGKIYDSWSIVHTGAITYNSSTRMLRYFDTEFQLGGNPSFKSVGFLKLLR